MSRRQFTHHHYQGNSQIPCLFRRHSSAYQALPSTLGWTAGDRCRVVAWVTDNRRLPLLPSVWRRANRQRGEHDRSFEKQGRCCTEILLRRWCGGASHTPANDTKISCGVRENKKHGSWSASGRMDASTTRTVFVADGLPELRR